LLALNRALYNVRTPTLPLHAKKPMLFRGSYRHQYWSVDIRYLDHNLGGGNIYAITILENYRRAVLASAISRTQDLTAYLMVLFAAIRMHGSPDGLVSDGGSVFKAKQALEMYHRLGIAKHQIDQGQAWQNYIETMFNVQRRMADAEVLDWVYGRVWDEAALHYAFYATRFGRRLDKAGYVRFRHYRLYAEPGLERRRVAVWRDNEQLSIEFNETLLVQYTVAYQPDHKHFRSIADPHIYATHYRLPQLPLWQFGDDEWLKVLRLPALKVRKQHQNHTATQERLFA